jgi:hypothetical protein
MGRTGSLKALCFIYPSGGFIVKQWLTALVLIAAASILSDGICQSNTTQTDSEKEVRALLAKFQEYYTSRNASLIDEAMKLFETENPHIIGTAAVGRSGVEWCVGADAVRSLLLGDWKGWGDVRYDVDKASISTRSDVAWIATTATVTMVLTADQRCEWALQNAQGALTAKDKTARDKLIQILEFGNEIELGLTLPDKFVWPLRFTAVAVRKEGQWRFSQMHFSFPITRLPQVRQ